MIEIFLAAFGGAAAAFWLEAYRRNKKDIKYNANKGNQALFQLIDHWSILNQFRCNVVEPIRSHAVKPIAMVRSQPFELNDDPLVAADLNFLIENEGHLVFDVILASKAFRTTIRLINERSQLYPEDFEDLVEQARDAARPLSAQDGRSVMGDQKYRYMERLTNDVIECVDQSLHLLRQVQVPLRGALYYACPRHKFVWIVPYDDTEQADETDTCGSRTTMSASQHAQAASAAAIPGQLSNSL